MKLGDVAAFLTPALVRYWPEKTPARTFALALLAVWPSILLPSYALLVFCPQLQARQTTPTWPPRGECCSSWMTPPLAVVVRMLRGLTS